MAQKLVAGGARSRALKRRRMSRNRTWRFCSALCAVGTLLVGLSASADVDGFVPTSRVEVVVAECLAPGCLESYCEGS